MGFHWPFALRKLGPKRVVVLRARSFRWAIPREHHRTIEWREWIYGANCSFTALGWLARFRDRRFAEAMRNAYESDAKRPPMGPTDVGIKWDTLGTPLAIHSEQVGDGAGPTGGEDEPRMHGIRR